MTVHNRRNRRKASAIMQLPRVARMMARARDNANGIQSLFVDGYSHADRPARCANGTTPSAQRDRSPDGYQPYR